MPDKPILARHEQNCYLCLRTVKVGARILQVDDHWGHAACVEPPPGEADIAAKTFGAPCPRCELPVEKGQHFKRLEFRDRVEHWHAACREDALLDLRARYQEVSR